MTEGVALQSALFLGLAGFAAGTLGGLLGVGGGILNFPVLVLLLAVEAHAARAATLLVNAVVSLGATLRNRGTGLLDLRLVAGLLAGSLPGAVLGVAGGNQIGTRGLEGLFAIFLLAIAGLQFRRAREEEPPPRGSPRLGRVLAVGAAMGLAAGLLGIGGGVVAVPAQEFLLGVSLRSAIANSSAVIAALCAVAGSLAVIWNRGWFPARDPLEVAAWMALPALLGGFLGARMAQVGRSRWIRIAFGGFLLLVASRLILG